MRRFFLCAIAILAFMVSLIPAASAAEPANSETITLNLDGYLPFFDNVQAAGTLTVNRTGTQSATTDTWALNLALNTGACTGSGTASEVWSGTSFVVTLLTQESWNCSIFQPAFPLPLQFDNNGSVVKLLGVPFTVDPPLQAPFSGKTAFGVGRSETAMPIEFNILHGRFYQQTAASGRGYGIRDGGQNGGTDSLGNPIPFWSLFRGLGGVDALGYPVTTVFYMDGLYYQAVQRGLFQWLPDAKVARPANVFDFLNAKGLDDTLDSQYNIPPQKNDSSADVKARLGDLYGGTGVGWLTDSAIRAKFIESPALNATPTWSGAYTDPNNVMPTTWTIDDAIALYGLPTSEPKDYGTYTVQRFQRGALQKWNANSADGKILKGSVVPVLSGDMTKLIGSLPAIASIPELTETTWR